MVRRHHNKPAFWFDALRLKRRLALFLLTVLYMPINRMLIRYFVECSPSDHLCSSSYSSTGSSASVTISTIPYIWWLLFPMTGLMLLTVPIFFILLIRKGVKQIDLNYGIGAELVKLQEEQRDLRLMYRNHANPVMIKVHKTKIRTHSEGLQISYAIKALQHRSAYAYLYSSYKRTFRFWKIFLMMQRISLLMVSIFVYQSWVKCSLALTINASMAISTIYMRPFSDPVEVLLEIVSQVMNALNALIALFLANSVLSASDFTPNALLTTGIIIFSIGLVAAMVSIPLRFIVSSLSGSITPKNVKKPRKSVHLLSSQPYNQV